MPFTGLDGLPALWNLPAWGRAVFSRDPHPFLQFIRYGLAGVLAMTADVLAFAVSETFFFPVEEMEKLPLPDSFSQLGEWFHSLRHQPQVLNYINCSTVGFFFGNAVAYVLNFKWVFTSGRHSRQVEILLFLLVSFIAFLFGTALGSMLVGAMGINVYLAKAGNVVAAVVINFVCRKFLVFQN